MGEDNYYILRYRLKQITKIEYIAKFEFSSNQVKVENPTKIKYNFCSPIYVTHGNSLERYCTIFVT